MLDNKDTETLKSIKVKLMNELSIHSKLTVLQGPFRGQKLSRNAYWGGTDITAKILGNYEREVQSTIQNLSTKGFRYLVDIGAGDGFYAVGALHSKLFDKVLAYERADKARENIYSNMKLNSVNSNNYKVFPASNTEVISKNIKEENIDPTKLVILVDIEGDEYRLIDKYFLEQFSSSFIIIEIHRRRILDIYDIAPPPRNLCLEEELKKFGQSVKDRKVDKLYRTSYEIPSTLEWLADLSDDERLLLLSESRDSMPEWWVIHPK
ncbi:hypothetical protein [Flexibacterium corallicola]|uniref:hypothetical protein n=1 Tax=Flexibacterium corallicola TaxID=3037259 RepID=UPI00286ECB6C|nr:hypothetical protein [Pseudovibrio sp. M1P-2-3]